MILFNNKKYNLNDYTTHFPDGTTQVWKLPDEPITDVIWFYENDAEIFQLVQLAQLTEDECSLSIPFLPYGRQDKEISRKATFALRALIMVLNHTTDFSRITSFDAHSDLASKCLDNFENIPPEIDVSQYETIVFPDTGASKRYGYLAKGKNLVVGEKVREQSTGLITHYELIGRPFGNCLVIDDICDGGATFVMLGKALDIYPRIDVDLYVTHGIFSKGIDELLKYYSHIKTTNTIKPKFTHERFFVKEIC